MEGHDPRVYQLAVLLAPICKSAEVADITEDYQESLAFAGDGAETPRQVFQTVLRDRGRVSPRSILACLAGAALLALLVLSQRASYFRELETLCLCAAGLPLAVWCAVGGPVFAPYAAWSPDLARSKRQAGIAAAALLVPPLLTYPVGRWLLQTLMASLSHRWIGTVFTAILTILTSAAVVVFFLSVYRLIKGGVWSLCTLFQSAAAGAFFWSIHSILTDMSLDTRFSLGRAAVLCAIPLVVGYGLSVAAIPYLSHLIRKGGPAWTHS